MTPPGEKLFDPTPEQVKAWEEWLASRPPNVETIARRFPPWVVFQLPGNGNLVTVRAFDESACGKVELRVHVSKDLNPQAQFERMVFGVNPQTLIGGGA